MSASKRHRVCIQVDRDLWRMFCIEASERELKKSEMIDKILYFRYEELLKKRSDISEAVKI